MIVVQMRMLSKACGYYVGVCVLVCGRACTVAHYTATQQHNNANSSRRLLGSLVTSTHRHLVHRTET